METKDIIVELRTKKGLSQEALAEKVFVTRQAVSRWETGETVPNTETLKLLSKLFDVSINTLLGSPRQLVCECCGSSVKYPIYPYFKESGIKLNELSARDIQDFYDEQLSRKKPNGEPIKASTVIHYHAIIRLSLVHARRQGYILSNPMNRPHKICHMVTSIDGKVTGEFLSRQECEKATDIYYELNREYNKNGANGFICGRVTMENSFTGGWYPDLTRYEPIDNKNDFIPDNLSGFYAVSFDPKGKLGWKNSKIIDEDPGYDDAQIIEVLTEQADSRYLAYLQSMEIPYIFAGKTEIDVKIALEKLKRLMGINSLLLEGGSIVNGYFQRADVIDELSLVVAPIIADSDDKPLFMDSTSDDFKLKEIQQDGDVVWMNYIRK